MYTMVNHMYVWRYKGPSREKLGGIILDRLHAKYVVEQNRFLHNPAGYGRVMTGDGATILGTKFINFLCHELGKGCMLCAIKDCTQRLQEVGTIDSTFIAHEMIQTIRCHFVFIFYLYLFLYFIYIVQHLWHLGHALNNRHVGPKSVFLFVIDGGADWVAAEDMVRDKFPWIYFMHYVGHEASLIVKDICKIDQVIIYLFIVLFTHSTYFPADFRTA